MEVSARNIDIEIKLDGALRRWAYNELELLVSGKDKYGDICNIQLNKDDRDLLWTILNDCRGEE